MIGRLTVLLAVVVGLAVLIVSALTMFDQMPPFVEGGHSLAIRVTNSVQAPQLIDENFATVVVVFGALSLLTVVFFVFLMAPKAGRSIASRRRQASGELVSRALDSLRGE